ncbi:EAL domain-containing protein [Persephonella sp.]
MSEEKSKIIKLSREEKDKIKEVFVYFYKKALSDRYLSTFYHSPNLIYSLIDKQATLLTDFLEHIRNPDELEKYREKYRYVFELHWNLDIEENYMFEYISFIEESLKNLIRNGKLNLKFEDVADLSKELNDGNAIAYIKGMFSQVIFVWENILESSQVLSENDTYHQHIQFLKELESFLDTGEIGNDVSDFTSCRIGKYLSSAQFLVKSYQSQYLINFIIHFHKKIHIYSAVFIDLYREKKFVEALRIARVIALNAYLFLLTAIEIESKWSLNKEKILYSFLSDPLFSNRTVSFFIVNESKGKLERELFIKVSRALAESVNRLNPEKLFAYVEEKKERLYIVVIEEDEKIKSTLQSELVNLINGFLEKEKVYYNRVALTNIFKGALLDTTGIFSRGITSGQMPLFFKNLQEKLEDIEDSSFVINLSENPSLFDQIVNKTKEEFLYYQFFENLMDNAGNIQLYAQTINHLKGKKEPYGVEVFARAKFDGSLIPAGKFIGFVKQTKNTELFDIIVIKKLREFIERRKRFSVKNIFVNLFPSSYLSGKVIEEVKKLNETAGKKGLKVVLEITEYENLGIDSLHIFKEMENIEIAIDDFGTGYSNFENLMKLSKEEKVKYLKIDGSFVRGLLTDDSYGEILKAVIYTAKTLNKVLIFEFIENREVEKILKKFVSQLRYRNSPLGQGYLYTKPDRLEKMV